MSKRFYQIQAADEVKSTDNFVGVRIDGLLHADLRYSMAQVLTFIAANTKQTITVSAVSPDTRTVSNPFFDNNTISEIVTNNQSYIGGYDFIQTGGVGDITGINITFFVGQVLIAKV